MKPRPDNMQFKTLFRQNKTIGEARKKKKKNTEEKNDPLLQKKGLNVHFLYKLLTLRNLKKMYFLCLLWAFCIIYTF